MNTSSIPQNLMSCSLMHFEQGVPIADLNIRTEHKERLARVSHVYWVWKKNPLLDTFAMFKQLLKGKGADLQSEWHMAQKDQWLLDFVIEHLAPTSRRQDEAVVKAAAYQAIKIGMDTDNAVALTKGGKLLYEVAHLGEPESEHADMSKTMFLPPVVVTNVNEIDDTKENVDDEEMKRIMAKYGGYIDEKVKDMDEMVEVMAAKRHTESAEAADVPATDNADL